MDPASDQRRAGCNMLHNGAVGAVSFHPDGRYIVTASEDHTARIWEWEAGGQGLELLHGLRELSAAEFSADGQYVATADSYDYNLSMYSVDRLGLDQSIARSDEDPVRMRSWCAYGIPRRTSPLVRTAATWLRRVTTKKHGCGMWQATLRSFGWGSKLFERTTFDCYTR